MPGQALPRHLLDQDPRHRELLSTLRAAGGYAYMQQLVALWPQCSRATAYRAVQRLAQWGALTIHEMPPRSVAILTRKASRYLGFNDPQRGAPTYERLMAGVYRLAWYLQQRRHLRPDLPSRRVSDPDQLEQERKAAHQQMITLSEQLRSLETDKANQEVPLAAAKARLFGGKAEVQRLTTALQETGEKIESLTQRYQDSHTAYQMAEAALTEARLSATTPAPDTWRRRLQARGIFLDAPDRADGLTFVAFDIHRSRGWLRDSLRLCGRIAGGYSAPWRFWVLTYDKERAKTLESLAQSILEAVPRAKARYRLAFGERAKEQAAQGIIDPLPLEVLPVDVGIAEYMTAPGGRRRDVRELLSSSERQAIAALKRGGA